MYLKVEYYSVNKYTTHLPLRSIGCKFGSSLIKTRRIKINEKISADVYNFLFNHHPLFIPLLLKTYINICFSIEKMFFISIYYKDIFYS
jgi:hypothetical protein